jgi:hypothetical protein
MRAAISRHLAANSRYSATVFMELPNGSSAIPKWNFPSVSFDRDATATCHTPLAGSVFDVQMLDRFSRATPRNHTISSFPANHRLKRMFEFQSSV